MTLLDYYRTLDSVITSGDWCTTYGEPGVFPRIYVSWDDSKHPATTKFSVIKEDTPDESINAIGTCVWSPENVVFEINNDHPNGTVCQEKQPSE